MQPDLYITDILEHICECADRRSLYAMARTARVLHESAIRALWSTLPGFIPLLRCFPSDSWTVQEDTFKFTRVLRPKDWTAVSKYASFVRHFVGGELSVDKAAFRSRPADAAVWETMCCLRPTATLFPQLRILRWGDIKLPDRCLPSFLLCAGPLLFSADFDGLDYTAEDASDTLQSSLEIMAERSPVLCELVLDRCGGEGVLGHELWSWLPTLACSFHSLVAYASRNLPIAPAAFLSLVRLKTLRYIVVRLRDNAEWPRSNLPLPSSNVRRVELFLTTQDYIAFSKTATLPHATWFLLHLQFTPISPSHLLPDIFHAMRRQCSPDALERIAVIDVKPKRHARQEVILPTHLQPLLEFKKVDTVMVKMQCRTALNDEFCAEMAKAWPCIETLAVGTGRAHDVLPTLRALPPFAIHCPKLARLALVFDARHWENQRDFDADAMNADIYGALADRESTSVLSRLLVGNSPGPTVLPESVAAFLARVFPSLDEITPQKGSPSRDQWVAVGHFLPLFKRVKKDERLQSTEAPYVTGAGSASGEGEAMVS